MEVLVKGHGHAPGCGTLVKPAMAATALIKSIEIWPLMDTKEPKDAFVFACVSFLNHEGMLGPLNIVLKMSGNTQTPIEIQHFQVL